RRGQPQQRHLVRAGAQPLVYRRHVGELQPPAELDAEESEAHVEHLPEAQARPFHRYATVQRSGRRICSLASLRATTISRPPVARSTSPRWRTSRTTTTCIS